MTSRIRARLRAVIVGVVATALASCQGDMFSGVSCIGGCGGLGSAVPVTMLLPVGFPDSLVSKDPYNQIGILAPGDSIVLRFTRATSGTDPQGPTVYQLACTSVDTLGISMRWGVSDSSIAMMTRPTATRAVVR